MKTKKNEPGCFQPGGRCVAWRMLLAVMLIVAGGATAFADDAVHAVINGVPYVLDFNNETAQFDTEAMANGKSEKGSVAKVRGNIVLLSKDHSCPEHKEW